MSENIKELFSASRTVIDHNNPKRLQAIAELQRVVNAKDGLRAVASSLVNPVQKSIDIRMVMNQIFVSVTNFANGVDFFYEKDLERTPAFKTAPGAGAYQIDLSPVRVRLDNAEIQVAVYVDRSDLFTRTFDVVLRAKERVQEGMAIRHDLTLLALASAACNSALGNPVVNTGGMLDKATLAKAFEYVEKTATDTDGVPRQLSVQTVLIEASGKRGLRNMSRLNMDEKGFQEIRESGNLGLLWGARFIETVLCPRGRAYTFAEDKYFGYWFTRSDVNIDMQEELRYQRVGIFGFQVYAAAVANATGACEIQFNPAA